MTTEPKQEQIMRIVLAKMTMHKLAELFMQFNQNNEIFQDGTVRAVLSAYTVPIKLKDESLPPQTCGKDPPLGRLLRRPSSRSLRRLCYRFTPLVLVRFSVAGVHLPLFILTAIDNCTGLSPVNEESIWRQVIIVYRGGILADWGVLLLEALSPFLCSSKSRHGFLPVL